MKHATHTLMTDKPMFAAVARGVKTFEIRKDDRAFQAGDTVILITEKPAPLVAPMPYAGVALPHEITKRIGFVLRGGQYGLDPGYVAFSLMELE